MPKIAIDKNGHTRLAEYKIRATREILRMRIPRQSKVAKRVCKNSARGPCRDL